MSFAIDEAKVEELLKSIGEGYIVSVTPIEPTIENLRPYYGDMGASGTIVAEIGPVSPEAREHLMEIRSKIVESGISLKGADELANEIEGMRGRSR